VALIEFALVLPFLLLIIFGMVDLGKAVSYWNDETHLANQAARYAAVNACAACDTASPHQTINAYIPTQAETAELRDRLASPPVGSGDGVFFRFTGSSTIGSKNHCTGQAVKVTVRYTYSLPFLGKVPIFGSMLGLSSIHISASSTTRLEQNWGDSAGVYRTDDYVSGSAKDRYFPTQAPPGSALTIDPNNPSHDGPC